MWWRNTQRSIDNEDNRIYYTVSHLDRAYDQSRLNRLSRFFLLHLTLLLLALRLIAVLLAFVERGCVQLGLFGGAQLFLVIVGDEVIGGLGIDHQLDRGFVGEVVHLREEGGYLVEKIFIRHGAIILIVSGTQKSQPEGWLS